MLQPRILAVDDKPDVRRMLRFLLTEQNYLVDEAGDVREVIGKITENRPDLILLDWMMPGRSGYDLMKQLRSSRSMRDIPIIMVTAKTSEDDQVKAMYNGADDYVTKPFSPRDLSVRIKALLRRTKPHADKSPVVMGAIKIYPSERKLEINDNRVAIGPTEFRLLHFFVANPGRVYSRAQILDNVWGINKFIEERTIDVHIRRLRKVLGGSGMHSPIETVRGLGYRFQDSSSERPEP